MKNKHPYDHQHLKQVLHRNEMVSGLEEAQAWVQGHLEAVLIGVVVLAAAGFGGWFFYQGQQQKALDAAKALNEAQSVFQQAGSAPAAEAAQDFNQAYAKYQAVVSGYDGTPQAKAAKLGLANTLLAEGKAPDAERAYADLDSRDASDPIAALAGYGRARSLELQGKGADAAKAYQDAGAAYPDSAVAALAVSAAARLQGASGAAKKG
ncbi:MAG TPA: tetratricopeptide repeat protein [bacterium]|nr:tetratricopeptide repeat protein [bacterium]